MLAKSKTFLFRKNIGQFNFSSHNRHRNNVKRSYSYVQVGTTLMISSFVAYEWLFNEFTYIGATKRFLRSLKAAALIGFDYALIDKWANDDHYEDILNDLHQKSANRLLEACLLNGGLYIKVGQGVASINHILPKEYSSTLAKLQDKCLPTQKADVQQVFKEEFGQLPEDIFDEFDYNPVAAASLAQVFHAKLKNGKEVAVKVQYQDLQKRFTSDLGTIIFLQDIVELIFKNYNFGWIIRDVKKNLIQEMDFVNEGKNSERCAQDLKKYKYVHIPKVFWDLTNTRVLTLEWIDGFKVTNVKQIKDCKLNLKEIDMKLFTMFSEQIFNSGFVHADPHPGNIFVRKAKAGNAELVLLDHGLYEFIPENVRLPLCEFWEATVLRDEEKMKTAAEQLKIKDYKKFAEVLFQTPIDINGGHVKMKLTEKDIAYMQEIAKKRFDLIMDTLRQMPRNMLFVVRNLNTIRAIGRQHGDVIDRPKLMARHAQGCLFNKYNTFVGYFQWIYRRFMFEFCLWRNGFKRSLMSLYFNVLCKINQIPAKSILFVDKNERN